MGSLQRLLYLGTAGLLLSGCPNPNIYGTARTITRGQIQHSIAIEGVGVAGSSTGFSPTLPTYQFRYGLADRVELGARLSNLVMPGLDVKWNFVRGGIDLAVQPGVSVTYVSASTSSASTDFVIGYFHLPLLVGFNLSPNVSLLLTPGILGAFASGTTTGTSDGSARFASGTGINGRFGVGAFFRLGNGFAIQPEITAVRSFDPDAKGVVLSFGLGFQFGAMPNLQ